MGENGKEAVDYALERHPDAVLMDIKMPVMDGIEALKEIRRHTTQLPVIMQTAYAFDTDRRIAEEAGCNGFITKPVMPRELKMYLDMSLKRHKVSHNFPQNGAGLFVRPVFLLP